MNIPTLRTNKKLMVSVGTVISVVTAIAMYYLLMPAWIIAIRIEDENALPSIQNRFRITEDDLVEFPSLREAMEQADSNYPYISWTPPTKAWYLEGKKIVDRFQMSFSYPPEYEAILIYDDASNSKKVYVVQVVFGYEQPTQQ